MDSNAIIGLIYFICFSLIIIGIMIYICYLLKKLSKQKLYILEIENVFDEFAQLLCEDDGFTNSENYYILINNMNNISLLLDQLLKTYEKYV